jgi:uncharacterized protein YbgA (DUF1722 family)/uncharacterized protein YbbK (DUF523 family)
MTDTFDEKITIGISSCLLGNEVRYNGGHQHDRYITSTLGRYFNFVAVCPEVECGLPIPREAMRLVGDPDSPQLVTNKTGIDHTERMLTWCSTRVQELENEGLCGFIFKAKSPSSGMERVKVYDHNKVPQNKGVGIFARAFVNHFPMLPVEEDGRLHDPILRENFIESVFVFQRWRKAKEIGTPNSLVTFHTDHKLLLRAHSEKHYRELGRIVAKAGTEEELFACYQEGLMTAMKLKPTLKTHINVLQHIIGHFKKDLSKDEKQELLEIFDQFKNHLVPLIVPITLLNHYIRKYDEQYLQRQHYLRPHPLELKLRNHS